MTIKTTLCLISILLLASCGDSKQTSFPPNILWITCEDISPFIGCYGDSLATTPHLDKLAKEGVRFTSFFANAPVCAPARFTILHGVHASSAGTMNMRSRYRVPEEWKAYPVFLRETGYYCTNNSKTDYNFDGDWQVWDESSRLAHYKNRKPGQPFFAIFNFTDTHESKVHKYNPDELIHDPGKMVLPSYVPDHPSIREDMAKLYDNITDMDSKVGKVLAELDDLGLNDSTIVFYYSDHGGVYPRSKRFIHRSGTQVPLIIKVPEAMVDWWNGGFGKEQVSGRLVSFVDLAPTVLSIAGIEPPKYMEGRAFMGEYAEAPQEEIYLFRNRMDERIDCMRAITDGRYRYQVNYYPHRPYGQHIGYLWRATGMQTWEEAWLNGELDAVQSAFWTEKPLVELYDMEKDPWEVMNLIGDPNYLDRAESMHAKLNNRILELHDAGFIPEGKLVDINAEQPVYTYSHQDDYPLPDFLSLMDSRLDEDETHLNALVNALTHPHALIRYWAATSCQLYPGGKNPLMEPLTTCLSDDDPEVRLAAGEALYRFGNQSLGVKAIQEGLRNTNPKVVLLAFNMLEYFDETDKLKLLPDIKAVGGRIDSEYVNRMVEHFAER